MVTNMENAALYAYVILVAIYRVTESTVMARTGTLTRKPQQDWTAGLIVIPYFLVIAGPVFEYLYFGPEPGVLSWTLGAVLFLAATFCRTKAHLDLDIGFSMSIEKGEDAQLVQTGLYRTIRHPLYVGNLLLFVACPLFLAARISWVFTALGFIGVLVRIQIEERFLSEKMEGYHEYMSKTWALIPWVY